jgi:SAM-dependent methyltransferase
MSLVEGRADAAAETEAPVAASSIAQQYDRIIAARYDADPQGLIGRALERATAQISARRAAAGAAAAPGRAEASLRVLDLGMGTGRFLGRLGELAGPLKPYGIDISQKMVEIARARVEGLTAVVDDVARLDAHFGAEPFDLVASHFVTGFVPVRVLAPKIRRRLAPGGLWSLVGGLQTGFPALQRMAERRSIRWLFGGGAEALKVSDFTSPRELAELVVELERSGFVVREAELFAPTLRFADFREFLDFAYYGGWLTPFLESRGVHRAGPIVRALLDACFFPFDDEHRIAIVLAEKRAGGPPPPDEFAPADP